MKAEAPAAITIAAIQVHRSRLFFRGAGATARLEAADSDVCRRTLAMSRARSRVEEYRSSGSFDRHRSTIQVTGDGTDEFSEAIGGGSSRRIAASVSPFVSLRNASLPVSIS